MPFESRSQAAACYAKRDRGEAGSWDCDEWSEHTNFKKLPEKKKKSSFDLLGADMAERPYLIKLASAMEVSPDTVRHLAGMVELPVIPFVKQAFADPTGFTNFLALATGATKQAGIGGGKLAELLNRIFAHSPIDPALRGVGRAARSGLRTALNLPTLDMKTTPLSRHTIAAGTAGTGGIAWNMMRNKPQPGGGGPPPPAPAAPPEPSMTSPLPEIPPVPAAPAPKADLPTAPRGSGTTPPESATGGMSPAAKSLLGAAGVAGALGLGYGATKLFGRRKKKKDERTKESSFGSRAGHIARGTAFGAGVGGLAGPLLYGGVNAFGQSLGDQPFDTGQLGEAAMRGAASGVGRGALFGALHGAFEPDEDEDERKSKSGSDKEAAMPCGSKKPMKKKPMMGKSGAERLVAFLTKKAENERLEKRAQFSSYLSKVAEDLPLHQQAPVRYMQAALASGYNLNHAIKSACPQLTGEQRGMLAVELVRGATKYANLAGNGMDSTPTSPTASMRTSSPVSKTVRAGGGAGTGNAMSTMRGMTGF